MPLLTLVKVTNSLLSASDSPLISILVVLDLSVASGTVDDVITQTGACYWE